MSKIDNTPPSSDREGDEEEDAAAAAEVDAYITAESLGLVYDSTRPWGDETDDSAFE